MRLPLNITLRHATMGDVSVLQPMIDDSVRMLQAGDYSEAQRETAIGTVFSIDTQLIRDGTYLVAEVDGQIVGCGGWSRRQTLYGGDHHTERDAALLNPEFDAARIRAFFIRPGFERRGIGNAILKACEDEAAAEGFTRFELGSTLTGIPLYRVHGYIEQKHVEVPLPGGVKLPVVVMSKDVGAAPGFRKPANSKAE